MVDETREPTPSSNRWKYEDRPNSLSIEVRPAISNDYYILDGRLIVNHGDIFGEFHFLPYGPYEDKPQYKSDTLLKLLDGLKGFFQELKNHPEKAQPEYIGFLARNQGIRRVAQSLGFKKDDEAPFAFIGKTDEIRKQVEEKTNKVELIDRLRQRAARELARND